MVSSTDEPLEHCPQCRIPLRISVFPAATQSETSPATGTPASPGEAVCFNHESRRAVVPCDRCGRFLCALCDLFIGDVHYCPACLEYGLQKGRSNILELSQDPSTHRVAAGSSVTGRTRCWLTPGHLLVAEQHWAMKQYRRLALKNLQALVLHQTRLGQIGTWLLSLAILVFGGGAIIAASTQAPRPITVTCAASALLFAVSLLLHRWKGATARLEIHTAVQRFVVPGVNRWRDGLPMFLAVEAAARQTQAIQGPDSSPADAS